MLAVIVGISILSFEDSNQTLRKLIKELNSLLTLLMDGLCRFIPALVFLMVVMQGWSGTFSSLLDSWLPVVLVTIVMVLYFLLEMLLISFKLKIPLSKVYQICLPTNMIALMTASSAASFGSMVSACEDGFEVDEQLTSFGVPLGIVVCKPSLVVTLVVFMFFCARTYGMGGDLLWYMHLGLAAFFYAIAVPPVPGGMLACYTMLFAELGIPATALALVTAIDLIVDYSTTWGSVCSVILNVAIAGRGFARQEAGRG